MLIVVLVQTLFDYRLSGFIPVAIYLVCLLIIQRFNPPRQNEDYADEPDPDYSDWPTSGPIGQFGQRALLVPWSVTQLFCLLNPFQAAQIFRQLVGNAKLQAREKETGDDGSQYETQVAYSLPFAGEWFVYNGGMTPKTSHSWDILGQRFALDFVKVDSKLRRHTGRGTKLEEYFCYKEEILAAADGTIVRVENRVRNAPLVGWGICDFTARSFVGNYVLIQHADEEFALYAHLIKNSIAVRPGQKVKRGEFLGLCGHSGHSTEPHLHFHLQESADLFAGMGLPVRFEKISVDGKELENIRLKAGNRVAPRPKT